MEYRYSQHAQLKVIHLTLILAKRPTSAGNFHLGSAGLIDTGTQAPTILITSKDIDEESECRCSQLKVPWPSGLIIVSKYFKKES